MEDRQVNKNASTRKRVSTIDMLSSEALTCAIEVEKEIAAAKDPKKMLAPAIKYFATDHYNWTAGVSLLQFSFILEQFIPRRWFEYNHSTMEDPIEERARVIVGSFGDGLSLSTFDFAVHDCLTNNVSLMSDVDQMVCHPDYVITKDASSLGVIETDDTHIGYARIRVTNPKYIPPNSDPSGYYFSSEATVIAMTQNTGNVVSGADRACKHGPAVQDVISRAGERFNIDRDSVLSIPCHEWPKEAGRWATRERPSGWPDKDTIERIVADGCHLVGTSHPKSRRPDDEWRYSFSVAERTLARSLRHAQRQCYILLKLIVMRQLKPCSVVCSYHLKTIFLWQCEKIIPSKWSLGPGLATTFLCLLDELLYCLATHHLPHYFIPENNLLEHVDADFLVDAARSLSHLRRDPLQHVLSFNARYRFMRLTSTTRTFDLTRHFGDVIDDARINHDNIQRRYELQQQALWRDGLACLREEMFTDAPFIFENVTRMLSDRSMDQEMDPPILEGFAGVELDLSEATDLLGRVDRKDVYRNSYVAYFLSRRAVTKCIDMTPEDEVKYRTDLSFRGANESAVTMDYCMFLVYLRRHEEAMPLLYAIIKEERDHPVGYNVYSKSMSVIQSDTNLRQETERHTLIRTMSVAFAYYTLVKIYCDTNEEAEVTPLLPDFQHLCSETLERGTVDSTMHAQAYSLLGYTYLAVCGYSQARQAFKRATQLQHGYTLAEENRDMCDDLMCGTPRPIVASLSSQEPVSSEGSDETDSSERESQRKSEITVFQVIENDDGSAGVSLLQLSFILDQVLPQRHIRRSLTDADRENIHATLSLKFDNLPEIKLEPSGSFYDGFHLPVLQQPSWTGSDYHERGLDSDFRLLAVHVNQTVVTKGDNTDDCLGVIEDDDTHPGYVRIQLVDPRTSSCKVPKADTGDFYLSTHVWEFEDRTFANLALDVANTLCEEPEENDQINSVHCESMSAIPCSQWPKEADRWITRDRPSGWPDENLVKTVIADGCHLVPMSHPQSRYPDVEWSYSFSVAERTLARSLTDAQRQCYILLKKIVMQQLSHCSALCLYHIKTVFLWQCEKIPASEWSTDVGLATNFLWLLDELLQCAATRDLPHYFIAEVNLFDHIHPDFLQVIADTLALIRRHPIEQVLAFFKHFHFEFSMTSCDLADILSNVIDDAKQGHDNPPTRFAKQRAVLLKIGRQFMREGKFDEALCVLTQISQFDFDGDNLNDKSPCRLMTDMCEELSAEEALREFDYIPRIFPNRGLLLANLAMLFHIIAFEPGNEQWKQELLKTTEENYLEAIVCGGEGNIQIMMDYAFFLVHLHRGDDAIPTLKEIIAREDDLPVQLSGYHEGAIKIIVDKNLLNEIDKHGTIFVPTVAIAYYVLVSIYCDTDQERDGAVLLSGFQRYCSKPLMERELDPTKLSRTLSLLGYTYQAMQRYTEAGQLFRRAAELEAGYTAAEENRDLCDALVLSLQQCSDD